MAKYIDLSSVVDEEFFKDFLCNHCNESDLSMMKEILDEVIEDSKDAD